jgi:hypothetical protein
VDNEPRPARPATRSELDHLARRPDLSLLERVELVAKLLGEAPDLPRELQRVRLISCESLLLYCQRELAAVLDGAEESGWSR